jgi:hypothetical protein
LWAAKHRELPAHVPPPRAEGAHYQASLRAYLDALRLADGVPAGELDVAWKGSGRYWAEGVAEHTSPFGAALRLQHVCWLDLSGVSVLPRGRYAVMMRLRVDGLPGSAWSRSVAAAAVESGGDGGGVLCEQATELVLDAAAACPRGQWLWMLLGGVTIQRDAAAVRFRLWDHNGDWKSGIQFDRVVFAPFSSLPAFVAVVSGLDDSPPPENAEGGGASRVVAAAAEDAPSTTAAEPGRTPSLPAIEQEHAAAAVASAWEHLRSRGFVVHHPRTPDYYGAEESVRGWELPRERREGGGGGGGAGRPHQAPSATLRLLRRPPAPAVAAAGALPRNMLPLAVAGAGEGTQPEQREPAPSEDGESSPAAHWPLLAALQAIWGTVRRWLDGS